jgi:prepilin-type N-terminal cleavage/methylation domain-containing protein
MKSQSGFTLLELLAVIMVIGISLAIAVPSYQGMVARNGIATQVNGYLLAINLARSEAMRRGSPVSIQSADNGADGADEFGNGYCVQVGTPGASGFSTSCAYAASKCEDDADGDGVPRQITGCILREFPEITGTGQLNSVEDIGAVSFGSLGELTATTPRNIDLCVDGQEGRRIRISLMGRSRSHRPGESIEPSCPP